jgi:hypothetical protein
VKNSEILAAANILSHPYFEDFWQGGPVPGGMVQGSVRLYKPGAAHPQSLGNCTWRGEHLQEVGEHQRGLEKSDAVDSAGP